MLYRSCVNRLTAIYPSGEAQAIVRLVLEDCFGLTLTDVICGKVNDLSAEDRKLLEKIMKRLEKGTPVQYVLGQTSFCGHTFRVAPGVLIPRPETEELVEWILSPPSPPRRVGSENMLSNGVQSSVLSILDIGTGSGCIAISLALALPDSKVEAWDISKEALSMAQYNAEHLGAAVTFREVDVLQEVIKAPSLGEGRGGLQGAFDVVVSNPPYICQREAKDMEQNVLDHEPHIALFVPDDDPLLFYRAIARHGLQLLKSGGAIYFEINRAYASETSAMLRAMGYNNIKVREDQFGNPRMLRASKR